jgi:hypothetical protein
VDRRDRRDTRYVLSFPAQITVGKRTLSLLTEDVSYGGIFLRTDAAPPLYQLVSVQLVLPVGDHAIQVFGMTVHVVLPDNPVRQTPGIGIQFYALDQNTRDSWDTFIRYVEARCPEGPDQTPLRLPRGFTPEPIRRRFERHTAVLKVEPATQAELEGIYERDVLTATMTIATSLELSPQTRVMVYISHPSSGQPFLLEALVLRKVKDPEGLALELLGLDRAAKDAFLDFVRAGIFIDEEVVESQD